MNNSNKEKLVVEGVTAHNLMPKDGEGSSSPFVEVEFEKQRQKTQVKYKDINPVWNEKLVFHVNDAANLPSRTCYSCCHRQRRLRCQHLSWWWDWRVLNWAERVCVKGDQSAPWRCEQIQQPGFERRN
ncbi:C2 domain-containing protein [Forsythia ovata]|uniref:C2 domain-containing protein n=1 Tax=Forsythia ovata TaxID=205694 RepID=A0ABD1X7S2_9LAMI